jgi:hypothetical protein
MNGADRATGWRPRTPGAGGAITVHDAHGAARQIWSALAGTILRGLSGIYHA